jgi:hypothetical protein
MRKVRMLGATAVTVRVRVHHIGHRLSLLEASELPDRNRQTPSPQKQADDEITGPPEIESVIVSNAPPLAPVRRTPVRARCCQ